jgi:hypothetical protein
MHVIGVDVGTNQAHATCLVCTEGGQTHDTWAFINREQALHELRWVRNHLITPPTMGFEPTRAQA